jgi:hypothetical protein
VHTLKDRLFSTLILSSFKLLSEIVELGVVISEGELEYPITLNIINKSEQCNRYSGIFQFFLLYRFIMMIGAIFTHK